MEYVCHECRLEEQNIQAYKNIRCDNSFWRANTRSFMLPVLLMT